MNAQVIPDAVPSKASVAAAAADPFAEGEYKMLRARYLEKRVRENVELPNGTRLRRQTAPPVIETNTPGYKALRKEIRRLERRGEHTEIFRLLKCLMEWDMKKRPHFPFPGGPTKRGEDDPVEVIDFSADNDDHEVIDVDKYIIDVLLLKVVKADPDAPVEVSNEVKVKADPDAPMEVSDEVKVKADPDAPMDSGEPSEGHVSSVGGEPHKETGTTSPVASEAPISIEFKFCSMKSGSTSGITNGGESQLTSGTGSGDSVSMHGRSSRVLSGPSRLTNKPRFTGGVGSGSKHDHNSRASTGNHKVHPGKPSLARRHADPLTAGRGRGFEFLTLGTELYYTGSSSSAIAKARHTTRAKRVARKPTKPTGNDKSIFGAAVAPVAEKTRRPNKGRRSRKMAAKSTTDSYPATCHPNGRAAASPIAALPSKHVVAHHPNSQANRSAERRTTNTGFDDLGASRQLSSHAAACEPSRSTEKHTTNTDSYELVSRQLSSSTEMHSTNTGSDELDTFTQNDDDPDDFDAARKPSSSTEMHSTNTGSDELDTFTQNDDDPDGFDAARKPSSSTETGSTNTGSDDLDNEEEDYDCGARAHFSSLNKLPSAPAPTGTASKRKAETKETKKRRAETKETKKRKAETKSKSKKPKKSKFGDRDSDDPYDSDYSYKGSPEARPPDSVKNSAEKVGHTTKTADKRQVVYDERPPDPSGKPQPDDPALDPVSVGGATEEEDLYEIASLDWNKSLILGLYLPANDLKNSKPYKAFLASVGECEENFKKVAEQVIDKLKMNNDGLELYLRHGNQGKTAKKVVTDDQYNRFIAHVKSFFIERILETSNENHNDNEDELVVPAYSDGLFDKKPKGRRRGKAKAKPTGKNKDSSRKRTHYPNKSEGLYGRKSSDDLLEDDDDDDEGAAAEEDAMDLKKNALKRILQKNSLSLSQSLKDGKEDEARVLLSFGNMLNSKDKSHAKMLIEARIPPTGLEKGQSGPVHIEALQVYRFENISGQGASPTA